MKRMWIMAVLAVLLITVPSSYGEMNNMMNDMVNHMDGGMMGKSKENKEAGKKTEYTKEAEASGVTVKITYRNPGMAGPPYFEIVLDTHSVDLDQYKLDEITLLRDDSGKEYNPTLVSSSGSSHHREAVLEFNGADISGAKFVELVIKAVAGADEMVFRFDLGNEMMK